MKIKKGTKFTVCDHDDLLKRGWHKDCMDYLNDDFPDNWISYTMIENWQGKTLTVKGLAYGCSEWYSVEENNFTWPIATFLGDMVSTKDHKCEEGMTPIDDWVICKTCGDNLRKIK